MEKKDIFIVIVCLILLLLWAVNQSSVRPPSGIEKETNGSEITGNQDESPVLSSENSDSRTSSTPSSTEELASDENSSNLIISEYESLPLASPITLTTENKSDLTINPEGGGITKIVFHDYKDMDRIQKMSLGFQTFPMFNVQNKERTWNFSHAKIEAVDKNHVTVSRAILGSPLVTEQTWTLNQESPFGIDYNLTLKNLGTNDIKLEDIQVNCGIMQPLDATKSFMGAGGIDQRVDILQSGNTSPKTINLDKIMDYDDYDREKTKQWRIDWLAVQNKYFVSLVSGEMPFSGFDLLSIKGKELESSKEKPPQYLTGYIFLPKVNLGAGQSRTWRFNCYVGPKKYDLLKKLGENKESILQFDLFLLFHFNWMKGISLGILWALNKLEAIFHNYGVAIIIITLLIRTVFWPITHQTALWSKRMQKIQPLAQEIREKYKSDPQKMQQKTMELYREHKINPVAGCLPMLLQIPVFFALFNVLRSAIELRQAQFLWAHDLSQQDSIYILPLMDIPINPLAILMGLTMIWQQKIVPTSPDPMQQKVMMFMTGFFVLILYSMPSGLTLYWSINQIVSIFQHKITRSKIDGESS